MLPHEILEVTIDASEQTIKSAYLKKAKELHPDVNFGKDTTKLMMQLNVARDAMLKGNRYMVVVPVETKKKSQETEKKSPPPIYPTSIVIDLVPTKEHIGENFKIRLLHVHMNELQQLMRRRNVFFQFVGRYTHLKGIYADKQGEQYDLSVRTGNKFRVFKFSSTDYTLLVDQVFEFTMKFYRFMQNHCDVCEF